ncbi:MAG: flagellar biosynthetic protein FliO [Gammaproteobacteria bacterium]|nr:flagellar biosynthetic protein FliO [Gammaproteobacteria bacterium]
MRIFSKHFTQNLPVTACGLLAAICPVAVQAAEKSQGLSPLGISGEVMGGGFLMQSVTALFIVLVSVVVLALVMRRFGRLQSSAKGALQMIDGMALSTRERIVLVQVGDTQVLLGVAPGRVEAVHVLDKPVVTSGREEMTGNFAARLKEVLGKEQR